MFWHLFSTILQHGNFTCCSPAVLQVVATSSLTRGILWKVNGYIGRYIVYTGDGFKEGLSLTVHDEITRLRKCGLMNESWMPLQCSSVVAHCANQCTLLLGSCGPPCC